MKIKTMTAQEYAKARGIGDAAVRKAIKLGHGLPGVVAREKFGRVHLLKVDLSKIEAPATV